MLHALVLIFPIMFIAIGIFTAITMGLGLLIGGLVGWQTHSFDNFTGTWVLVTTVLSVVGLLLFVGWLV